MIMMCIPVCLGCIVFCHKRSGLSDGTQYGTPARLLENLYSRGI